MSAFNNSFSNRCFAAFLSMLLMIPTGWGLHIYWNHYASGDRQDGLSRALVLGVVDLAATGFVISVLGVIWAAFAPLWIGRFFHFAGQHLIQALAVLLCIMLALLAYAWLVIYG